MATNQPVGNADMRFLCHVLVQCGCGPGIGFFALASSLVNVTLMSLSVLRDRPARMGGQCTAWSRRG